MDVTAGVVGDEGSLQPSLNHPGKVQEWLVDIVGAAGALDMRGGDVMVCEYD